MDDEFLITTTHNMITADRTQSGMIAVASILEICPVADGHISSLQGSNDAFFIFIAEHASNRIGALTAVSLVHLLNGVLPKMLEKLLKPAANSEFDIFVDELIARNIHDRIAQLQIGVAREQGKR